MPSATEGHLENLERMAPVVILSEQDEDFLDICLDKIESEFSGEEMEWNAHRIASEIALAHYLKLNFLPWHERKFGGESPIGEFEGISVWVSTRKEREERIWLDRSAARNADFTVWTDVRLIDCDCKNCSDAPPRPETRVRLLGAVVTDEVWNNANAPKNTDGRVKYLRNALVKPLADVIRLID